MQENTAQDITDVEFKETPVETKEAPAIFNPVEFLTNALAQAGYPEPAAWTQDIDPLASTHEDEKARIFFANRALRLYLSEIEGRDNISPRLLLADGIDSTRWIALMEQGVIPWLMGAFNERGDRVAAGKMEIKEFNGDLGLTEDQKTVLRAFFADDTAGPDLAIDDKIFSKVHRNGANCREFHFVSQPNVFYPLALGALLARNPHDVTKEQVGLGESTDEAEGQLPADEASGDEVGVDAAEGQPVDWGDIPAEPEQFAPTSHVENEREVDPQENMAAEDDPAQDARPSSTEP